MQPQPTEGQGHATSGAPSTPDLRERLSAAGRDFTAALVVSLAALSFYISSASLLFQGTLAPYLPVAIGAALLGGIVLAVFGAAGGSLAKASFGAEPAAVPVLATITAGVAAQTAGLPGVATLATAVVTLALTGLAIGLTWWWMGRRGAGDVIRYIPYPVIGGFIGSVGWLMFTGGMGVSTGEPFSLAGAWTWLSGHADARLAAGIAIGVIMWQVMLRTKHPLSLPSLIVLSVLAIYAGLWFTGADLAQARSQGWLLAPFSQALPLWPGLPSVFGEVQWSVVAQQAGLMVSAVIVTTISLLLADTSLEMAWDEKADINRDLKALGKANIVAAAAGGLVGGISVSRSVLNHAAGAASRGSGLIKAAICVLAMAWGGPVLALVPRPLLGGLLIYLGLGMLKTWLFDSRKRLPGIDYAVVVAMVATAALVGFLPAVFVGVLTCCVSFAVSSGRLTPVRRMSTRAAWPSKVERSAADTERLQGGADRVRVVELQGVLFFGSATQLTTQIDEILQAPKPPECLLFDFKQVHWVDSSAGQALGRIFRTAGRSGVKVALSTLSPEVERALAEAGCFAGGAPAVHGDIDAAMTLWDEEALRRMGGLSFTFEAWLDHAIPGETMAREVMAYFEPITLAPGETLFSQGDPPDALYLVRSGRLSAYARVGEREFPVLSILVGGAIGEMGLFRSVPRSSTIRAEQESVLMQLSRTRLEEMEAHHPHIAAALYRQFLRQLASRLEQATARSHALSM